MSRLLASAILLCLAQTAYAADWGPWDAPKPKTAAIAAAGSAPLVAAVRFFQKQISPLDGPRCPMYPSCSSYSLQALHRHGPLFGTFLTVDRLYREIDAPEQGPPIAKVGYWRFFDPLSANDFWLSRPQN